MNTRRLNMFHELFHNFLGGNSMKKEITSGWKVLLFMDFQQFAHNRRFYLYLIQSEEYFHETNCKWTLEDWRCPMNYFIIFWMRIQWQNKLQVGERCYSLWIFSNSRIVDIFIYILFNRRNFFTKPIENEH